MDDAGIRPGFAARTFPAFSIFASIGYFLFMGFGLSPFVYYPETGDFTWAAQPDLGPPMFWYGWMVYAAIVGLAGGLLTYLLPIRWSLALVRGLGWLLWAVPTLIMLIILFLLRHYF
ncbi:hypothetical protein [Sphingomonas montanisoli]|uniref:Uncharacterized protein n=1 Tax=Sphingomonas montanisoli TaxID=2606412 RepID=A0A5D9C823_9SPHN|nr:hypothetical protein [Sphingomonas montanisoli]TZG27220.1 hypothetical protein FYJ91_06240 [Sphingomonas montanisoli]